MAVTTVDKVKICSICSETLQREPLLMRYSILTKFPGESFLPRTPSPKNIS